MSSSLSYFQFDPRCEALIVAFDQARREQSNIDVDASLLQVPLAQQPRLIAELACIDLEHAFEQGQSVDISPFLDRYPNVFHAQELRAEIAKEHYRLCRLFGLTVARSDLAHRYDLEQVTWDELPVGTSPLADPAADRFPSVGTTFCGHPLIAELGRGALARVYIARQPDLAQRWVVLKITQQLTTEAEQLAGLQHSGIIPVYSIHQEGQLYAICMPYLGAITLANLLADGRLFSHSHDIQQQSVSTLVANRLSTIVSTIRGAGQCSHPSNNCLPSAAANPTSIPAEFIDSEKFMERLGLSELSEALQARFLNQEEIISKVLLMEQLSEAVGYAHSRGICHRDLKPENILIANDGRPIILDFNLAASNSNEKSSPIGGTLPYMSPEHLRSLATGGNSSPQDDVFAIGVIFYQLLTGKLPYDDKRLPTDDWEAVAANHAQSPPSCRTFNHRIPPSLNSIVLKCLASATDSRYRSAQEVREDLLRFVSHRVLKYAPDRSAFERIQKFVNRHPHATSMTSIISIASLVVAGLMVGLFNTQSRATRLEASQLANQLDAAIPEALAMLRSPGGEPELLTDGIELAQRILQPWNVTDDSTRLDSTLRHLTDVQRGETRRQLGDLLYAIAGAEAQLALLGTTNDRNHKLADAKQRNQLAANLWPELVGPVRLRLLAIDALEQPPHALGLARPKFEVLTNAESAFATMLAAREVGNTDLWLQSAEQLVSERPADPTRWFNLASARFAAGDLLRAGEAFDFSAKLQQDSATSIFWRGVTRLQCDNFAQAEKDFSISLELRSNWIAARYNRALAKRGMGHFRRALDDLDWIVAAGQAGPRVYSLRAQLQLALGDKDEARAARTMALRAPPRDADDWVSLGVLKMKQTPQEALQDFERAIDISPRNVAAQINTAHVQSEILGDNVAAIQTLSKLVDAGLGGTTTIASRGILRARAGNKRLALSDAQLALHGQPAPLEMLQIAGIYALISANDEERQHSLAWLARAVAADPSLVKLAAGDPDLVNVRESPAFLAILELPLLAE